MECTDKTDIHKAFDGERLPPGQRETTAFPVLSKGDVPSWTPTTEFRAWGALDRDRSWTLSEFRSLPHETQCQDFHCVTGWSRLDCRFTGVPFTTLAERLSIDDDVVSVTFHALDGYTTALPLSECMRDDVLFAWALDGEPLSGPHGGPLRVLTPHKYAYKGAKWVSGIAFRTEHERGYWERRGYSDSANPWAEERYA